MWGARCLIWICIFLWVIFSVWCRLLVGHCRTVSYVVCSCMWLCYAVGVRVALSVRLDPGLHERLVERAVVERRSMTNMIELLLERGLGTVVTEPVVADATKHDLGWMPPQVGTTGSVTAVCPNERMHRSGVYCKQCGRTM